MKIIPEALALARLQRTSMNEEQINKSYLQDFQDILNCQTKFTNILDIGCGVAGWECFLINNEQIYLIDKTEVDPNLYYGYKEKTSFYNSMEIAKKNLMAHKIKEENIHIQEAKDNKINFDVEFDLIVSFISCGFHYPVETYLDQIYEKLKKGGNLIIDIRKGTTGLLAIKKKFGNTQIIRDQQKYWRIKATK